MTSKFSSQLYSLMFACFFVWLFVCLFVFVVVVFIFRVEELFLKRKLIYLIDKILVTFKFYVISSTSVLSIYLQKSEKKYIFHQYLFHEWSVLLNLTNIYFVNILQLIFLVFSATEKDSGTKLNYQFVL